MYKACGKAAIAAIAIGAGLKIAALGTNLEFLLPGIGFPWIIVGFFIIFLGYFLKTQKKN